MADKNSKKMNRRDFVKMGTHAAAGLSVATISCLLLGRSAKDEMVWQLDPDVCVQCEKCAVNCVLPESAVKVMHSTSMCGYCDLCSGYLEPGAKNRDTSAESQLCPTGAIKRLFIEDPYFEYSIDKKLCIGCAKCVKGCGAFGNGSLYLQVQHDRCVNCNECSIAVACPAQAYKRVPAKSPYILRGDEARKEAKNNNDEKKSV